ncbi:MAG: hypothetical protein NVS4B11_20260 [Ktedonobacteraceae bacterium]
MASTIVPQRSHDPFKLSGPGDRAPDGHCLRFPARSETSLFQEFRGTASHMLLFAGLIHTEAEIAKLIQIACQMEQLLQNEIKIHLVVNKDVQLDWDGSILLDPKETLHKRYSAELPSLYFIRPDGYIGFRCQPVQEEPLLKYLRGLFVLDYCSPN